MSLTSYQTAPPRVRVLLVVYCEEGRGGRIFKIRSLPMTLFVCLCLFYVPSMEGLAATYSPTP